MKIVSLLTLFLIACGPPEPSTNSRQIKQPCGDDGSTCVRPNGEFGLCVDGGCKKSPTCKAHGPDFCSNKPNATHCHADQSSQDGFCHQSRCLTAVDGEAVCPMEIPDAGGCDASNSGGSGGSVGGGSGGNGGGGVSANDGGMDAPSSDAEKDGQGGSAGNNGSGGAGGIGGNGDTGGTGGDGDGGTGGTGGGPGLICPPDPCTDGICLACCIAYQWSGGSCLQGSCICAQPGTDSPPPASAPPPTAAGQGESGRVGWGCEVTGAHQTASGFCWVGLIFLLGAFFSARVRAWRPTFILTILGVLLAASAAFADEPGPLHLTADGVIQLAPTDDGANGGELARRAGGEFRVDFTFHPRADFGMGASIGEDPGYRAMLTLHSTRGPGRLGWFAQPRFIVHPKGDDAGLGGGLFAGGTVEAGPGRFELGPALELYTSPGNSIQNYAFLFLVGYQLDLMRQPSAPPPAPAPIPAPLPRPIQARRDPPVVAPKPVPKEPIVVDAAVLFDFDSAKIRQEAQGILDGVADIALTNPGVELLIVGHTCSIGTESYNASLSLRRAEAVREYLKWRSIDPARMRVEGKGESEPAFDNETKEGRRKNRRVVFKFEEASK